MATIKDLTCVRCKEKGKLTIYHEGGENYMFCPLCSAVLKRVHKTGVVRSFSKGNYEGLGLTQIEKDMIQARIDRSRGKSPWQKLDGDNKGQEYGA